MRPRGRAVPALVALAALAAAAGAAVGEGSPAGRSQDVGLNGIRFDPAAGLPAALADPAASGLPGLVLIQLGGAIEPEWPAALTADGVEILDYVPHDAYLAWVPGTGAARVELVRARPFVRAVVPYPPALKLTPDVRARRAQSGDVQILAGVRRARGPEAAAVDPELAAALARLEALGARIRWHHPLLGQELVALDAPGTTIDALARDPEVVSLSLDGRKEVDGEVAKRVLDGTAPSGGAIAPPGYSGFLAGKGVDGSGVTVAVIDTGVDVADASGHLNGRVLSVLRGSSEGGTGHGHHVGGIVAGRCTHPPDPDGYLWGAGVAPGAALLNLPALRTGYMATDAETVRDVVTTASTNGVAGSIAACSWNSGAGGDYTALEREWDAFARDADDVAPGNQQLLLSFSAGNNGPGARSLTRPHAGKNLIAVGSSLSLRPALGGSDWNAMALTSSRGPAEDGRIKPDVTAPGQLVVSAQVGAFDCGYPAIDARHVMCSGTSMAQPHVAGAAALFTQWWQAAHAGSRPSPALVKAALVNGARDLAPLPTGPPSSTGPAPNSDEGFGLVDLDRTIAPALPQQVVDESVVLDRAGAEHRLELMLADPSAPLAATLAWTDAPGAVGAAPALVNDLDLALATAGGITWSGNAFADGASVPGGAADRLNNVEKVLLPLPPDDVYTLRVQAAAVPGDGIPGNASLTDQDFALVVANAVPAGDGSIRLVASGLRCGTRAEVFVADRGVAAASVDVRFTSATEPAGEVVTLAAVSPGSSFFRGGIDLAAGAAAPDGRLQVADGDSVTVAYDDADDGTGRPALRVDATPVDCRGPRITAVRVTGLTDRSASIEWMTDEPATSAASVLGGGPSGSDAALVTSHRIPLAGLTPCTRYAVAVTSTDAAGNTTVDDAGGPGWPFTTWGRDPVYRADFEADDGGFTHLGPLDDWAWGGPVVEGPATAHSADRLFGTNLSGKYPKRGKSAPNGDLILVSPEIDLAGRSGARARLALWHDIATDGATDDGAWVQVIDAGRTTFLTPLGGYGGTIDAAAPVPLDATGEAWDGRSPGWIERELDLSAFDGRRIRLEIHLFEKDDFLAAAPGLYVDDVEVFTFASCRAALLGTATSHVAGCSRDLPLEVRDADLDLDPAVAERVTIHVASRSEPGGEDVVLTETGLDAPTFAGSVLLDARPASPDGVLAVADGDQVDVLYRDADDGTGTARDRRVAVPVDCRPPVLSGITATPVSDREVEVTWTTDEPATSHVRFGAGVLDREVDDRSLVLRHAILLQDLDACVAVDFTIESVDAGGERTALPATGTYAATTLQPFGAVFADDFERDRGWTLAGEWERAVPDGARFATSSSMDPNAALSRARVLGVDVTGLGARPGDYEPGLTGSAATSPRIDLSGHFAAELRLSRWLGVDRGDSAWIELSDNDGGSWSRLWTSPTTSDTSDRLWKPFTFDLAPLAPWTSLVRLRFGLDSDASRELMGWQLDDVSVVDPTRPAFRLCDGPLLSVWRVPVDDAAGGDGDGVAEPGETVRLPVELRDPGSVAATGVTARLESGRPDAATFVIDTANWPDIPPFTAAGPLTAPPELRLSAGLRCGETVPVTVAAASTNGARATLTFELPVGVAVTRTVPVASPTLAVPIPDFDSHGVVAEAVVAEADVLRGLEVTVDADHAEPGDLVITLTSPWGAVVTLHDSTRAAVPYRPTTYPAPTPVDGPGALSDFFGRSPAGRWTLRALDARRTNTGTLRGFTLRLTLRDDRGTLAAPVSAPLLLVKRASDLVATFGPAAGAITHALVRSPLRDLAGATRIAIAPASPIVAAGEAIRTGNVFYAVRGLDGCGREGP